MKYELRHLSFGETLGEAFNLYFDNFIPLFFITLVSSIPAFVLVQTTRFGRSVSSTESVLMNLLILLVLYVGVNTIATALIIELISKKYLKQHQSIGQYIQNVLPLIFPIIGLSILVVIIIGVGLVLFIIPGIYFTLGLIPASLILIVERKKVMESISRSFFLTGGKKLEIFGFVLVLGLIGFAVQKGTELIMPMIAGMDASLDTRFLIFNIIAHLVQILVTPISSCVYILIYFNLRIEKEGFDLEHLVDQFASPSIGEQR